jgi:hypothetical protein
MGDRKIERGNEKEAELVLWACMLRVTVTIIMVDGVTACHGYRTDQSGKRSEMDTSKSSQ